MDAGQSLIADLEDAIQSGSKDKRVETLRRITDLFVADADRLSDQQIDVFDDVLGHLIKRIEAKALAELSRRLGPINNAPIEVVRRLARDDNITVAEPILTTSLRLSDGDLIDIASSKTQAHLLAISARQRIGASVTDVLLQRGDREVLHKLAGNSGADFSVIGFELWCGIRSATNNWPRKSGCGWTSRCGYFGSCCCAPPRQCVRAFLPWPARRAAIKFSVCSLPSPKMRSTKPAFKTNRITRRRKREFPPCTLPVSLTKLQSSSLRKAIVTPISLRRFHCLAEHQCRFSRTFCKASIAKRFWYLARPRNWSGLRFGQY